MTDREKNIKLAEFVGYAVNEGVITGDLYVVTGPGTERRWNPLHNIADAMEIYERAARAGLHPGLFATCVDGAFICRVDLAGEMGEEYSTIPAAISEAVLVWLEEQ